MSALDTLRTATPARKTATLYMDLAAEAEWEAAFNDFDAASVGESLEKPATVLLAEKLDPIRDRMLASEVVFTFERLSPWQGLALQVEHPARDGNPIDKIRGFNLETYFPALIRSACISVHKHGEDPEPVPDDVWESLLGKPAEGDQPAVVGTLNQRQVDKLIAAARWVNDMDAAVPPSARSLLVSQDSGASSEQPSPGLDQAPSDSTAGNPLGSPKSSTTKKARSKARPSGT